MIKKLHELTQGLTRSSPGTQHLGTSTVTRGEVAIAILKVAELASKVEYLESKLEVIRQLAVLHGDNEILHVIDSKN